MENLGHYQELILRSEFKFNSSSQNGLIRCRLPPLIYCKLIVDAESLTHFSHIEVRGTRHLYRSPIAGGTIGASNLTRIDSDIIY